MLTADLVRTRVYKGRVIPRYLDVEDDEVRARAEELVAIFQRHVSDQRGAIDQAVEQVIGHGTDFLVWRGLAKLLYDRSEFETVSAADPGEIRRTLFELAAAEGPVTRTSRGAFLEKAAESLGLAPQECEEGMYADLEERQRLVSFDALEPLALLHRYNLALAQAVLYKATELEIELRKPSPNKLRYLFQVLKFQRLMHLTHRTDDGYRLVVDGPASVLKKSRKYGVQLALFLPALLHLSRWQLTAQLDWDGKNERRFELSADDGLVSHYSPKGQWVAEEERYFEERFGQLDCGWTLERRGSVLDLDDGQVLVPDYVATSESGREVFIEIVGFWRRGYLERRIDQLEHVSQPLVIVVAERLKTDRKKLDDAPTAVVFYKGVILADKVLEAVETVAERSR